MKTLVITNGDSAAQILKVSGKQAEILAWRDILHEGPLSFDENWKAFDKLRANYLHEIGFVNKQRGLDEFSQRAKTIGHYAQYDEIELWFEHDLYDQLQLIEILARLHGYKEKIEDKISLIQTEDYLGMQRPDNILRFEALKLPVTAQMLEIASLAWQCITSETPVKIGELIEAKPAGFLFLSKTLLRLLQELPGTDGLSRTERQMIYSIHRGVTRTGMLFARCQGMEEAQFHGDWTFYKALSNLCFCEAPLIKGLPKAFRPALFKENEARKSFITSELNLTDLGKSVLDKQDDFLAHNQMERWVGGTKVTNIAGNHILWRFDDEKEILIPPQPLH